MVLYICLIVGVAVKLKVVKVVITLGKLEELCDDLNRQTCPGLVHLLSKWGKGLVL